MAQGKVATSDTINGKASWISVVDSNGAAVSPSGGPFAISIAAASTNVLISSKPGRLYRVLVTTSGTAALTFYDNASNTGSTSGNIIGAIPANATVGQVFDFQFPASTGISTPAGSNTPAVTVCWG